MTLYFAHSMIRCLNQIKKWWAFRCDIPNICTCTGTVLLPVILAAIEWANKRTKAQRSAAARQAVRSKRVIDWCERTSKPCEQTIKWPCAYILISRFIWMTVHTHMSFSDIICYVVWRLSFSLAKISHENERRNEEKTLFSFAQYLSCFSVCVFLSLRLCVCV